MEPDKRAVLAGIGLLSVGIVTCAFSIWGFIDPDGSPGGGGLRAVVFAVLGAMWIAWGAWQLRGLSRTLQRREGV